MTRERSWVVPFRTSSRSSIVSAKKPAIARRCVSRIRPPGGSASTYLRYPASVGMRPAEVCGCERNPSSSSADSSFRIVALETPRSERSATVSLPTGSPVRTNSSTTARSTSIFLVPSSGSTMA